MSGFQQDINQLQPNFYRVTLDLSDGNVFPSADGNDNGAVYTQNHSQFTTLPTTIANARKVARGHLRFLTIIEEVTKFADAQIISVEFASAGVTVADNQPTEVTFTVRYDRDTNVLLSVRSELFGKNNNFNDAGGNEITTVAEAVKELVVQGICRGGATGYTRLVRVYNPVQNAGNDEIITIVQPDEPGDVYDEVTVTLVSETVIIP